MEGKDRGLDSQRKAVASICSAELKIKLKFQRALQRSSSQILLAFILVYLSSIYIFSYLVSTENFLNRENLSRGLQSTHFLVLLML